MARLKVFEVLADKQRISSIDIFRAIAILGVVGHHYNVHRFPSGALGVDLFFVISGFLIGGMLTKKMINGERIVFSRFFLERGMKIWPSYYTYLIAGNLLAYLMYRKLAPDQILHFTDLKKYVFFYQNYTGNPLSWSFIHLWSICVEEHFYILLPSLFIFVQFFFTRNLRMLIMLVIAVILLSVAFKFFGYFNHKNTYSATHYRVDALGWGVLLNFIINLRSDLLQNIKRPLTLFSLGFLLLMTLILISSFYSSQFFESVIYHTLTPIAFTFMIMGVYYRDFTNAKILRIIAYYSYNWYLWHQLFSIFFNSYIPNAFVGMCLYLVTSFLFAVFFTIFIEEYFLSFRKRFIESIFVFTRKLITR